MDDQIQIIKKNYDKFVILSSDVGDKTVPIKTMLEVISDRLATCPASTNIDYHNAIPGGLIDHSLRVLGNMTKLVKTYNINISKESLIIVSLFHDIGKIGNLEEDLYLEQKSDYQRKQGWRYEFNKKLQYMSVSQRSLWLLQHFGVSLSEDEYLAILLSTPGAEEFKSYQMKEPVLATLLQMAKRISILQEEKRL